MKKEILAGLTMVAVCSSIINPSQVQAKEVGEMLKGTAGVVFGVPVGGAVGGIRGLCVGGVKGTKATAEALGNKSGIVHNIVGAPTGGLLGGVWGGLSGISMGVYDGVRYGWSDGIGPKSISASGTDLLDYDPFYSWNDMNWDEK